MCMTSFGVHISGSFETFSGFGELCRKIEDLGFDSIWLADGPTRNMPEPLPVLAYASAFTNHVKLGTCVYIIPVRHPLVTAKLTATVDRLSNGRLILGVGVGWRQEEFSGTGVAFEDRGKVADECLEILRQAWEKGTVRFEGSFFRIQNVEMELHPLQKPRPEIWVGGNGLSAARRAARFGEFWIPTDFTVEEYQKGKLALAEACRKSNRSPSDVRMASHLLLILDRDRSKAEELAKTVADSLHTTVDDLREWSIIGDSTDIARRIEAYNEAGVTYHVFNFATRMRDEARMELLARDVLPSFR